MIAALIPAILPLLGDVIKKVVPDVNIDERTEAMIAGEIMKRGAELEKAAASVVVAEAQSEHWLAATWRPITMLVFVFIIAWNYVIAPILNFALAITIGIEAQVISLEIPPDMWTLLTIGLGGYVVSRGAEKVGKNVAGAWRDPDRVRAAENARFERQVIKAEAEAKTKPASMNAEWGKPK